MKYLSLKILFCVSILGLVSCDSENIDSDVVSSCGRGKHVHAVDLGLSVKWACCNVGANSPEEYGDYFAWGETEKSPSYDCDYSVTCRLSKSTLKSRGIIGADGNLTAAYDAATANWGGGWRMPTLAEIEELYDMCFWEWTAVNRVIGLLVTGPNGNSIFLPAAGYRIDEDIYYRGEEIYYWSASLPYYSSNAYYLDFDFELGNGWRGDYHCVGFPVRPVKE